MPRDESGEYERPPRNAGNSVALWLILGVVTGILLLCGGVTAVGFIFILNAQQAARQFSSEVNRMQSEHNARMTAFKEEKPERAIMSRADFRAKVMGKTAAEVVAAVGKPDSTQDYGNTQNWYYDGATVDPVTGKKDILTQLQFSGGRVIAVNF